MRIIRSAILLSICAALVSLYPAKGEEMAVDVKPPAAKVKPKKLEKHGDVRVDNYYWLNERENPEVIEYLEAENAYTETLMAHTKDLQKTLFEEIKGRIKETDESVPYKKDDYYYYYRYEEGNRTPLQDPEADEVIRKVAADLGRPQKTFTDEEILKRCVYPLVNIGAKILEEGHALRASDIDTVYCNGYGFPTHVGGPMWYADSQGLANVLADIERFFDESGDDVWRPAEILKKLVAEGRTFASLDADA